MKMLPFLLQLFDRLAIQQYFTQTGIYEEKSYSGQLQEIRIRLYDTVTMYHPSP